jgi:hypothetical protein
LTLNAALARMPLPRAEKRAPARAADDGQQQNK